MECEVTENEKWFGKHRIHSIPLKNCVCFEIDVVLRLLLLPVPSILTQSLGVIKPNERIDTARNEKTSERTMDAEKENLNGKHFRIAGELSHVFCSHAFSGFVTENDAKHKWRDDGLIRNPTVFCIACMNIVCDYTFTSFFHIGIHTWAQSTTNKYMMINLRSILMD